MTGLQLAKLFHDACERLAPEFGYGERGEKIEFDVESKSGRLTVAAFNTILDDFGTLGYIARRADEDAQADAIAPSEPPPQRIYLQWAGSDHESTHCVDKINDDDIPYDNHQISADLFAVIAEIAGMFGIRETEPEFFLKTVTAVRDMNESVAYTTVQSFRKGWEEAMVGDVRPVVSELWDGVDNE